MDTFSSQSSSLTAPVRDAAAVTPSDAAALPVLSRALYVGAGGDLAVVTAGGQSVVFTGVPAGSLLPVRAARVLATGTSAGAILALW
ncbi:spike base protein, RCAP_Rcc01079 family [Actibacterium sp. D379-3]